eukprot:TRINITY_DN147_c0_g1_i2.p1 TRINITY_DN147_c0_g1~~TRINITY_DN147_c0_g1_i2.p1  ORF type:complete len:109 (-),score=20.84 TRINITY_DN147_c0_g1_i2:154-480(-)
MQSRIAFPTLRLPGFWAANRISSVRKYHVPSSGSGPSYTRSTPKQQSKTSNVNNTTSQNASFTPNEVRRELLSVQNLASDDFACENTGNFDAHALTMARKEPGKKTTP